MARTNLPFTPHLEDGSTGDAVDTRVTTTANADASGDDADVDGDAPPDPIGWTRSCYNDGTQFIDANLRPQWERNQRAFASKHPSGSKYLSDTYKHRSNIYRPKTRAAIRTSEAQAAQAYFTSDTVTTVSPLNENRPEAHANAAIIQEIMGYRLKTPNPRVAIPWFLTVIGAMQEATTLGVVTSKQWWEYDADEEETTVPLVDQHGEAILDEGGKPLSTKKASTKVKIDRPRCDLFPIECVRIDRSADWRDPVNTSPYVQLLTPMYVHEVEARMKEGNNKTGESAWKQISRAQLRSATSAGGFDPTRSLREDNRQDSKESEISIVDMTIVWIVETFCYYGGKDWVWFSAGTDHLLSDPIEVDKVYRHCRYGERPVVMGMGLIEAHKVYPSGKPQLTENLQRETNDLANGRLDNIKLALMKRYFAKRGAQVDIRSLTRNTSGSVTLVNDTEKDVKVIETRDVTAGAYQEQDRINLDMDDVWGSFSTSSVSSNSRLNETVGGMEMLQTGATIIAEYDLKVFNETWVEKVLTQIARLIQVNETDEVILSIAGEKAKLFQKFGVDAVTDELLANDLVVRCNVGTGATDPMKRLAKFEKGAEILGNIFGPALVERLNQDEVVAEVMGAIGFQDGKRFFKDGPDAQVIQMKKALEDLQQKLDIRKDANDAKVEAARLGAKSRVIQQFVENQGRMSEAELQGNLDMMLEQARQDGNARIENAHQIATQSLEALKASKDAGLVALQGHFDLKKADKAAAAKRATASG